jgi:hypothetical protein
MRKPPTGGRTRKSKIKRRITIRKRIRTTSKKRSMTGAALSYSSS